MKLEDMIKKIDKEKGLIYLNDKVEKWIKGYSKTKHYDKSMQSYIRMKVRKEYYRLEYDKRRKR